MFSLSEEWVTIWKWLSVQLFISLARRILSIICPTGLDYKLCEAQEILFVLFLPSTARCFLMAVTCTLYRWKVRLIEAAESRKLFYCAYSEDSWCWNKLAESLQVQESSVSATGLGATMPSNALIIIYTKLNCLMIVCTFQFWLTMSCLKVHCQTNRKIVKPGIWADNFHCSCARWHLVSARLLFRLEGKIAWFRLKKFIRYPLHPWDDYCITKIAQNVWFD